MYYPMWRLKMDICNLSQLWNRWPARSQRQHYWVLGRCVWIVFVYNHKPPLNISSFARTQAWQLRTEIGIDRNGQTQMNQDLRSDRYVLMLFTTFPETVTWKWCVSFSRTCPIFPGNNYTKLGTVRGSQPISIGFSSINYIGGVTSRA